MQAAVPVTHQNVNAVPVALEFDRASQEVAEHQAEVALGADVDEGVGPGDDEAGSRMERDSDVGADAGRRGHVLGQLTDGQSNEHAPDQGDEHGQRQRSPTQGCTGHDGVRGSRSGSHRRDGNEQDFSQGDAPLRQTLASLAGRLFGHQSVRCHWKLLSHRWSRTCLIQLRRTAQLRAGRRSSQQRTGDLDLVHRFDNDRPRDSVGDRAYANTRLDACAGPGLVCVPKGAEPPQELAN